MYSLKQQAVPISFFFFFLRHLKWSVWLQKLDDLQKLLYRQNSHFELLSQTQMILENHYKVL